MPKLPSLADSHLELQARLRAAVTAAVAAVWAGLPGHDRGNVDQWLSSVLPLVLSAQHRSVALTDAYVARALDRPAIGINPRDLVGAAVRNGTPPAEVYHRPFVQMWSALGNGVEFEDALAQGQARAESLAATDIQLSHLRSYNAIGDADDRIVGWQRVPDGKACSFCQLIATRRYHKRDLQPVHPHCGCGTSPITETARDGFVGLRENDRFHDELPDGVVVHTHGELGPVLAAPGQHFQGPDF